MHNMATFNMKRVGLRTESTADNSSAAGVAIRVGALMENSAVHGIPNIKRAQSLSRRLMWSSAFLIAFGLLLMQLYMLIAKYRSHLYTTNLDIVSENTLLFPAVTICNMNGVRKSKLHLYPELNQLFNSETTNTNGFQDWDNVNLKQENENLDLIYQVASVIAGFEYDSRKHTGHILEENMLSCSFSGYPCIPANFTYIYNYLYGNCYTFNDNAMETVATTAQTGPNYGLTIQYYIDQSDYIADIQPAAGLRIFVHRQKEMPFPEDHGVSVPPGMETSIGIHMTQMIRLASPYTDCQRDDKLNIFSEFFTYTNYSKDACEKSCLHHAIFDACHCYDPRYTYTNTSTPVCSPLITTQDVCMDTVSESYASGKVPCNCQHACFEKDFTTTISSSKWPNTEYESTLYKKLNATSSTFQIGLVDDTDFIQNNVVKVNLYYSNLDYDNVYQTDIYDIYSLLSDFGGQLGLWIGMSALTVVEFIECFFDICKFAIIGIISKKKKKENKSNAVADIKSHQTTTTVFNTDPFS